MPSVFRDSIIHHEFNEVSEGLLTAKFFINTYKNTGDKKD
jgi:hypothetical protein